jgi:hypothetical protein
MASDPRRALLGLHNGASLDECKVAYRRLVLSLHPDTGAGKRSQQRFLEVTAAYESLLHEARPDLTPPRRAVTLNRAFKRRSTPLYLSGLALLGGVGIFVGALRVHTSLFAGELINEKATAKKQQLQSWVSEAVRARREERDREMR